jgi:hypothetical protein
MIYELEGGGPDLSKALDYFLQDLQMTKKILSQDS